ncbi:phage major capsid protein [Microbacterium aurantiacum]|uniref:phage major capsid protein n=1 Tax=Microbacterium aurantiacum TaxID=162393 RepID=UPI003434311B
MGLKEQLAALQKQCQAIVEGAKASQRDLTDDEIADLDKKSAEALELKAKIERAEKSAELIGRIGGMKSDVDPTPDGDTDKPAKSLGEHFVKHAGAQLKEKRGEKGASVGAPEFKAASDTHTIGSVFGPVLTEVDRTIVPANRPRLVIADLLSSGTISGNAISYFVEGALEGAFTTVAEGGAKPQMHFADPTAVTDALKKIAGWIKVSDEMIEDLDFVMSEINNRLVYELAKFEEAQLLNGAGTGSTILGILNRSGVQTEARGNTASGDTAADTIFRAITKVQTGSGLDADGLVIHPSDYQTLRLAKDANGQYYGGGFFNGAYGNGGISDQPNVWGLRTVVTPAIAAGTVLVGAFAQAATVYRKGGVRVESTNSHASDFTSNLVTVRAEERLALAVRRPLGFVKTTITPAA